jgi:glycosyltransferase involved in cell wall biosynthesis
VGAKLAITAMKLVVKEVTDARLHVIGKGHLSETLELLVCSLAVSDHVVFCGFLSEGWVKNLMMSVCVSIAPYLYMISQRGRLHFDSSKTKYYAHFGVPTVLSDAAPVLAREVDCLGAGIAVQSDVYNVARGLMTMMTDDKKYLKCLAGCRSLANQFNYVDFLTEAFAQSIRG